MKIFSEQMKKLQVSLSSLCNKTLFGLENTVKVLTEKNKHVDKKQDRYQLLDGYSQPNIPPSNEERRKTDRLFYCVFVFCIIVLGVLPLICLLSYADINRYKGYDSCGNICGQKNREYSQWHCTGRDFTLKPILQFCGCSTEKEYCAYEFSSWAQNTISTNLKSLAAGVAFAFFVPFSFCLILAVLFRYATAITVWVLLILCWVIVPGSSIFIWLSPYASYILLPMYLPIILAIYVPISLLIICVSIAARRKIALIIAMLKEASKTIYATPRVIFNVIKTSVISFILIVFVSFAVFFLRTSGILTELWTGRLDYIPTSSMIAGYYLCGAVAFWLILYVIGTGFLNTSADVANKYFLRKEANNAGPTSQCHLGTIALVSLLTGIMAIPRFVLVTLAQISVLQNLMDLCLRYVDGYCTKNVYVTTAMHGTSFDQSGKKAVKLSKESVGNSMSALNFADYLLILTQIMVTVVTFFILMFQDIFRDFHTVFDYYFVFAIAFISTELVLGHVKMAISTIFFCVCQDNLLEKEANRSYTMSRDEYLTSSDKFFVFKVKERRHPSNLSPA